MISLKKLATLLVVSLGSALSLHAGVTVNSPLPITHNVVIQPIVTKHSNGETAMFLGSNSSEAYIKAQVDLVWAQSGLSITWLSPIEYQNDFAYDGSPSNYSSNRRPSSHLRTVITNAGTPPKSPDSTVINMFFMEIVPGFSNLSDNYANGLAYVDSNGIGMHVGRDLVNWNGGRDVVASVMAHEIGHNLGLSHYSGSNNLMASGDPDSYLLTSQTNTIFTDNGGIDGYDFLSQTASPTNYDIWAENHSITGGPYDDDDNDGLSNILEFALDLDPEAASSLPTPVWSAAGLTWTFNKNSNASDDGIEFTIEVSDDCDIWIPAGSDSSSATLVNNSSQISARLNSGLQGSYMRLNATIPQEIAANAFTPENLLGLQTEPTISCCSHGGCGCQSAHSP